MAQPFRLCVYSRRQSRRHQAQTQMVVHSVTTLEDEDINVSFDSGFHSVISKLGIRWRTIPT